MQDYMTESLPFFIPERICDEKTLRDLQTGRWFWEHERPNSEERFVDRLLKDFDRCTKKER